MESLIAMGRNQHLPRLLPSAAARLCWWREGGESDHGGPGRVGCAELQLSGIGTGEVARVTRPWPKRDAPSEPVAEAGQARHIRSRYRFSCQRPGMGYPELVGTTETSPKDRGPEARQELLSVSIGSCSHGHTRTARAASSWDLRNSVASSQTGSAASLLVRLTGLLR